MASPGNRHCANCFGTLSNFPGELNVPIDMFKMASKMSAAAMRFCTFEKLTAT